MTCHYVYILAGQNYGPIFIESVQDIFSRIVEHKRGHLTHEAFRIDRLVYVEKHATKKVACDRVRALNNASRVWIDALIEKNNPKWRDLTLTVRPQKLAA